MQFMNYSVYCSKNEALSLYEVPFVVVECLECVEAVDHSLVPFGVCGQYP